MSAVNILTSFIKHSLTVPLLKHDLQEDNKQTEGEMRQSILASGHIGYV